MSSGLRMSDEETKQRVGKSTNTKGLCASFRQGLRYAYDDLM